MSRLTRDGTAEPISRDQILRHARGQGSVHFPCSADHEQDWQPYPVDPYSALCDDHTYIHTVIPLFNSSTVFQYANIMFPWIPSLEANYIHTVYEYTRKYSIHPGREMFPHLFRYDILYHYHYRVRKATVFWKAQQILFKTLWLLLLCEFSYVLVADESRGDHRR